jgi:hypothetical protein
VRYEFSREEFELCVCERAIGGRFQCTKCAEKERGSLKYHGRWKECLGESGMVRVGVFEVDDVLFLRSALTLPDIGPVGRVGVGRCDLFYPIPKYRYS